MALGIILSAVPLIVSLFESGGEASRLRVVSLAVFVVFFCAAILRAGWFYFNASPKNMDKSL